MRVALSLDKLPLINAAFEKGELSYSKVRAMTRVATDENEEFLLKIASNGTASHIEKLVRKFKLVQNCQDCNLDDEYEKREFKWRQEDNGMWASRYESEYLEL